VVPVIGIIIFDFIGNINKMGVTILLVEQNVLVSLDIAHRGYVIEVGSNVLSGTNKELANNDEMRRAYLGI